MTQTSPKPGLNDTRLVRVLSDLAVVDVAFSPGNFAQRLGGLVDFGDSMKLATFHDELSRMAYEHSPNSTSDEGLKEEVLQVRLALVRVVAESFVPDVGSAQLKIPTLGPGIPPDQLLTFEPYHRFYAAHQREFESRIQTLQLRVREVASGVSVEMAQLAAMDEAVRDILSMHTRKSLAVVPQLLGKRFDFLLQEHRSQQGDLDAKAVDQLPKEDLIKAWTRPDGWLDKFCKEMQGLLFAELELRLMPILGLVEAIDEKVIRK